MDLAYRRHPQHLPTFLTHQRIRETPVGGGSICQARRLTLEDGASVFAKSLPENQPVPPGFFETEATGLRWLAEATSVGGAGPRGHRASCRICWCWSGWSAAAPSAAAAERFGRELAATHRAGADSYRRFVARVHRLAAAGQRAGRPVAGVVRRVTGCSRTCDCLPTQVRSHLRTLCSWNACCRASATTRIRANDRPGCTATCGRATCSGRAITGLAGRPGRARRAPGDGPGPARALRRRAAPGPDPGRLRRGWPLADGWRARVPLHQLHLLLVHAALFGGAYREPVVAATRAALARDAVTSALELGSRNGNAAA